MSSINWLEIWWSAYETWICVESACSVWPSIPADHPCIRVASSPSSLCYPKTENAGFISEGTEIQKTEIQVFESNAISLAV